MLSLLALLSTSWLGIALGEPYNAVYARMGDPLITTQDANVAKFVYLIEHDTAFVTVLTQHGRVSGVRLWSLPTGTPKTADPFGIALNDDTDKLLQERGKPMRTSGDSDGPYYAYQNGDVLWVYHINGNQTIRTITVAATESAIDDLSEQTVPAVHTGSSPSDAIVMNTASAADAEHWENLYLAVRPCANSGTWHASKRVAQTQNGASYDAVTASCSTGGATETVYFTSAGSRPAHAG